MGYRKYRQKQFNKAWCEILKIVKSPDIRKGLRRYKKVLEAVHAKGMEAGADWYSELITNKINSRKARNKH